MASFFITGTDTNVGKTWATLALMYYFKARGKQVIGMKPVASGCDVSAEGLLHNADALLLQAHSSVAMAYSSINPYAYLRACSPHIAGADNPADLPLIKAAFEQLQQRAQVVLVEGAGGWYSPINARHSNCDLAQCLAIPVILVVAIKLGCLNHALLSYEALQNAGVACAGWLAVYTAPPPEEAALLIETLQQRLVAPLLGILPYVTVADFAYLGGCIHSLSESPTNITRPACPSVIL